MHVQPDNKVPTIRTEVSPSSWISPDAFSSVIPQELYYYCRRASCLCTTINTLPLRWWTVRFPNLLQSRQILRTHWSKSVNVGMTALHPGYVKGKESCWLGEVRPTLPSPLEDISCVMHAVIYLNSSQLVQRRPFLKCRVKDTFYLSTLWGYDLVFEVISN